MRAPRLGGRSADGARVSVVTGECRGARERDQQDARGAAGAERRRAGVEALVDLADDRPRDRAGLVAARLGRRTRARRRRAEGGGGERDGGDAGEAGGGHGGSSGRVVKTPRASGPPVESQSSRG